MNKQLSADRSAEITRKTKETDIWLRLDLDGSGVTDITSGIGFLDHMLDALGRHSRIDLTLQCKGDLQIDDHHTAEDCALAIGMGLDRALSERRGIRRFGWALAPLDEALARAVIDISGRPHAAIDLDLKRPMIGGIASENLVHVFQSIAMAARMTLHVRVLEGENDHHKVEAAFKALALALRQAVSFDTHSDVPSTKGVL